SCSIRSSPPNTSGDSARWMFRAQDMRRCWPRPCQATPSFTLEQPFRGGLAGFASFQWRVGVKHHLPAIGTPNIACRNQRRIRLAAFAGRMRFVGQYQNVRARFNDTLEVDLEVAPAICVGGGGGQIGVAHGACHSRKGYKAFPVSVGLEIGFTECPKP